MQKLRQKAIYSTLLSLVLIFSLSFSMLLTGVSASNNKYVIDNSGLMSDSTVRQLEEKIKSISSQYDFDIVLLTVDEFPGDNILAFADDYYVDNGYRLDEGYGGLLFIVSLPQRDWGLSTAGTGLRYFTEDQQDVLENTVVPYLSSGDFDNAFSTVVAVTEDVLSQGLPEEESAAPVIFGGVLLISAIIALVMSSIQKGKLKSVRAQRSAESYVAAEGFKLAYNTDTFLYSTMTVIPKPKDNNNSGTRTSSSGTSHGGRSGKF